MTHEDVYFYVNGPARLLQACVIAEELYPAHRKHLILLHQFGYRYDALLPHVRPLFARVLDLRARARRYSHADQFLQTYLNPQLRLRRFFGPGARVILFGLRSPVQKFIVRHNKRLGNTVDVYAESLAVDRYFGPRPPETPWRAWLKRRFARAFVHQHDYDAFYVIDPEMYRASPHAGKLRRMFDLYGSPSFRRFAALLTRDVNVAGIESYDTVLLGQPLSNYETYLEPAEEERMLREIVGERRVLVLPHPNERLDPGRDKYRDLPNARVFRAGVSSELLLLRLRPATTITYYSTAGVNYAMMNAESRNYFYPIHRSLYDMLCGFRRSLPNIRVSGAYLVGDHPYLAPRHLTRPVAPGADCATA